MLGFAKWTINFSGNYTAHSKFQATPTGVNRECVGYYSVNCSFTGSIQPKYSWSLRNTFTIDAVDLSLLWRHISAVNHEPLDIVAQGPFFSGTLPASTGPVAGRTVDFNHINAADYFDLTARFSVGDNLQFTATVRNLLDRRQHGGFDHLQQRQHLSVDLRRAGPRLRGVGQAQVLSQAGNQGNVGGGQRCPPLPFA
jgi:outer membrane receptor protein involved in Fe transport